MRIGIVGFGYIGQAIFERIVSSSRLMQPAFVYNRSKAPLTRLDRNLVLDDLAEFTDRGADLVVEAAHPDIARMHGADFLKAGDYMPLSSTALIDDDLRSHLLSAADRHGTRLFLPAGALVGGEALQMRHDDWQSVTITFRKHPDNIDFSEADIAPDTITDVTTLFEGPVRQIAGKFPRNVNTMVTCALLTNGLDACNGVLIADPLLDCAVAQVEALASDGGWIRTEKRQPAIGVSGTEMVDSVWQSILRASGATHGPMAFV